MTQRTVETEVPYSAAQMYALVADIEKYPEFLPWCVALRVIRREPGAEGDTLHADMIVAYKVFREQFRTEVQLDPAHRKIDTHYVNGPFRHLHNRWRFEDKPEGGSKVHFHIEFEFRNMVLQATARAVFEKAFARMTEAFVARADEVYGGMAD